MGTVLSSAGRYKETINALNKAIKVDSNDAGYFDNLDAAYIRLDLELIASSTEATKLDSTNAVYFNQLGDAYLRSGQYEEAIAPYFKSVYYSKGLDNMSKFTNLIPINFTVLEKQKIITKLIIPLNKVFIQNGKAAEQAKLNIADAFVKYTELTLVGGKELIEKELIEKAIKLYFEVATDEALNKACSLAGNERFAEKEKADIYYHLANQYALKGNTLKH